MAIERLMQAIRPDVNAGEAAEVPRFEQNRPDGLTSDVDFWTSRDVREVQRSHLNYIVADTLRREQSAAYYIDTNQNTIAFVKNSGLGFAIPYTHNDQLHEYVPDFIVRVGTADKPLTLILETKGYDPTAEVKKQAAERWVAAVNADGRHGRWSYAIVRRPEAAKTAIDAASET